METAIRAIEYYLPERVLGNDDLAAEFEGWTAEKIGSKTGISQRHIVAEGECASDLALKAAERLFNSGVCTPEEIDFILLCTQSPDYFLPTTACLLQDRLHIPVTAGALDFNLGCSGYIYGLGLANGLIKTGQASKILFLTAETYSRYLHKGDRSVRTIFGDAAAATLICPDAGVIPLQGAWVWGTDGSGADNLIVPVGGMRRPPFPGSSVSVTDEDRNTRAPENLFMDGGEVFTFTLRIVPEAVQRLLALASKTLEDIDLFVFHQANQYMLEHLRKKLKIPAEKFVISMASCGNTVSSTIPIALRNAQLSGQLQDGMLIMLLGFGVGYSWGGTLIRWPLVGA